MKITIQDNKTSVTVQPRDFKVTISGSRGPAGPSEWGGIDGDIEDQTDLYNALQARVPYTGATADVNLGEYGAQLGNLEFDNTPANVPTTAGSVYWSDTDGTLNMVLKGGQTISRIGETQHIRALNNTGSQIARGKVVYVVGAQGQRLTIALADADTEILSKDTIGFTSEAIADGAEGFVIVQGVVNNISTTGMTDGATVYLSQTAGSYTTTPPPDPAHLVILGFIVNGGSGGAGSIYVKVDNGYELEELHNVSNSAKSTPVGDDALFLRDSADNNLWKRLTWTNALAGVKTHMDTFKSVAGGYASLDGSGKVPSSELPSYVDDVVEVANYAALPVTGETGKIYVTLDTNKCYRWSGTVYVQVAQGFDTLTTTGTSGAATLVGSTLNIPQYQSVLTNPVTGTGTAGQVSYWSGTGTQTGSSNLTYDNTLRQLKINGISSNYILDLTNTSNSTSIRFEENGVLNGFIQYIGSTFATTNRQSVIEISGKNAITFRTSAEIARFSGSNLLLNTTIDNGQRLQVNGTGYFSDNTVIGTTSASARLHVRGSGTTSSTTALLVQNSAPSALLTVTDDGVTTLSPTANTSALVSSTYSVTGSGTTPLINLSGTWNTTGVVNGILVDITDTASNSTSNILNLRIGGSSLFRVAKSIGGYSGGPIAANGYGLGISGSAGIFSVNSSNSVINSSGTALGFSDNESGAGYSYWFLSQQYINKTYTSGTGGFITLTRGFAPTSGSGVLNILNLQNTINQTGGANGITRGLYVNPTLTAAADWRSIEFSNNTGWGLYGAGTANNYLGGSLGIGTTSLTNYALRIGKSIAGNISSVGFGITSTISSAVTSSASLYLSLPSTQAASFTLSQIRHFEAGFFTLGEGSSITNQYGFFCGNLTQATNNYGFYGDIASGTGRWNLYMNGTAANYLAGNTSIGTTTSSGRLTVRGSGTTSATNGLLIEDSGGTDTFTIRDDGGYAFKGGTVGLAQTGYTTFTNLTTDRTCDANATTVEELADILGTLIEDLKTKGIISA